MIGYLEGTLKSFENGAVLVIANGIGFKVSVSRFCENNLPQIGDAVSLWIETVIRSENIQLCGFLEKEEQQCFQKLLLVQGVGVRVALAILSVCSPLTLIQAIDQQTAGLIEQADGVGKKVAQRILLELKNKMGGIISGATTVVHAAFEPTKDSEDALTALVQLGYQPSRIRPILATLKKSNPSLDTQGYVKYALQQLANF